MCVTYLTPPVCVLVYIFFFVSVNIFLYLDCWIVYNLYTKINTSCKYLWKIGWLNFGHVSLPPSIAAPFALFLFFVSPLCVSLLTRSQFIWTNDIIDMNFFGDEYAHGKREGDTKTEHFVIVLC